MPNHVINRVTFENLSDEDFERLSLSVLDAKGELSFDVLLPVFPLTTGWVELALSTKNISPETL
jgi:hypothetical protein